MKVLRGGSLTPLAWRDVVVGDIIRVSLPLAALAESTTDQARMLLM